MLNSTDIYHKIRVLGYIKNLNGGKYILSFKVIDNQNGNIKQRFYLDVF